MRWNRTGSEARRAPTTTTLRGVSLACTLALGAGCGLPRTFGLRGGDGGGGDDARADAAVTEAGDAARSDAGDAARFDANDAAVSDADDTGMVMLDGAANDIEAPDAGMPDAGQDDVPAPDVQSPDAGGTGIDLCNGAPAAGIAHVAVGDLAACALRCDGQVLCWGDNHARQLGRDLTSFPQFDPTPARVTGLLALEIAAGARHFCAIDSQRQVVCWGDNSTQQLGVPSGTGNSTFSRVPGPTGVLAVAANGGTTCVWDGMGALWCWGRNDVGQAGGLSNLQPVETVDVPAPTGGWTPTHFGLGMGEAHACAPRSDDSGHADILCWGEATNGRTGVVSASTPQAPAPVAVLAGPGQYQVMGGDTFTLAVGEGASKLICWGSQREGRCGTATGSDTLFPTSVGSNLYAVLARSSGTGVAHGCAVQGGTPYCWGHNEVHQAHGAAGVQILTPYRVTSIQSNLAMNVVELAVGQQNTCAVTDGHQVVCWGGGGYGMLGGTTASVDTNGLSTVSQDTDYVVPFPGQ